MMCNWRLGSPPVTIYSIVFIIIFYSYTFLLHINPPPRPKKSAETPSSAAVSDPNSSYYPKTGKNLPLLRH
jgi:hypothetical protein